MKERKKEQTTRSNLVFLVQEFFFIQDVQSGFEIFNRKVGDEREEREEKVEATRGGGSKWEEEEEEG